MSSPKQEHRHSNSFTRDAVAAFMAMHRLALRDTKYIAILRSKGMQELARKFQHMATKDAEREEKVA